MALAAAPTLRLNTAAVGPITIATGQNGPAQEVDANNAGDGSLSLTTSANVAWIATSLGTPKNCYIVGACLPIQIALNTATLAKGKYTGIITVSDPNAIDAPQTIVVTIQIGGGVPDSLDLYVPPNSSASSSFITIGQVSTAVTNPSGGPTLSIATSGGGSFSFSISFQVTARVPANTPENDYHGSIAFTGATVSSDNKTVPVTVHVTSQPIATITPTALQFNVAQGAAKVDKWIQLTNAGLGTLSVTGATATGGSWLSVKTNGNLVILTGDPTGLSPGPNQGSVTISSNAKNGPFTIPVEMDVVPLAAPTTFFQGVRDNALFAIGDPVAPGGIVEVVGEQFTTGPAVQAQMLPLGTALGGATVFVNNEPAPIYYASASHVVNPGGQINFQVPYDIPAGEAVVRVDRDGQRGNSISVRIVADAPRLLVFGPGQGSLAGYAIAVLGDNVTFPIPTTAGVPSRPAKVGDAVTFYALGFGQTNPPVTAGVGAPGSEPLARVGPAKVIFGQSGTGTDPFYAGLTPSSVGLYQINVIVPAFAPTGDRVPVYVATGGVFSNIVNIAIQ
jgi:uncharacterized protein (TIGR03437 family)